MRGISRTQRPSWARLLGAALLAIVLAAGTAAVSSAGPTEQDLADAKARLRDLNRTLDQLVEDFDAATVKLHALERVLAETRVDAARAQAAAQHARDRLSERATLAYEGVGSGIEVVLGASTFAEFSDSLQFLESLAKLDAEAAAEADVTRRQAELATARFEQALQQRRDLLDTLAEGQKEIEKSIADQQGLIRELEKELSEQEIQKVLSEPGPRGGDSGGGQPPPPTPEPPPSPPPPPPPPPPPDPGADTAVDAAYSVLGVKYTWGGDDPQEGFDCSGLTMWAWAQAGVSLPHSSAAQYNAVPHVSQDDLKPGDLLFFYQPISHVAMFVGGNQMIHATHPGGSVTLETIADYWWDEFTGAGRPG